MSSKVASVEETLGALGSSVLEENVIERSSCSTCFFTRPVAVSFAQRVLGGKLGSEEDVVSLTASNRAKLREIYGLPESVRVMFAASARAGEYVAAFLGVARAREARRSWSGVDDIHKIYEETPDEEDGNYTFPTLPRVVSAVAFGADLGSAYAAGLRHQGGGGKKGLPEHFRGVPEGLVAVCDPSRDGLDVNNAEELEGFVDGRLFETAADQCLLQVAATSKNGMEVPRLAMAYELFFDTDDDGEKRDDVTLVVDATQARVTRDYVKDCLDKDIMVILSGSTFFAAAPNCAAILLPSKVAHQLDADLADRDDSYFADLGNYLTDCDAMPHLNKALPSRATNHNRQLALRWSVALFEMDRFFTMDSKTIAALLAQWQSRLRADAEHFYPYLEVIDVAVDDPSSKKKKTKNDSQIAGVNTILSIFVRRDATAEEDNMQLLTRYDLDLLRRLLATDLSDFCDGDTLPRESADAASAKIRLGDPVTLWGGHSALRLALSAPSIVEAYEKGLALTKDDSRILQKITLLASRWSTLRGAENAAPTTKRKDTPPPKKKKKQKLEILDHTWLSVPKGALVNDERLAATTDAMTRWNACKRPVVADSKTGSILDGHHHFLAARRLGLKRIPTVLVELDDDREHREVNDSFDVYPLSILARRLFANPIDPCNLSLDLLR